MENHMNKEGKDKITVWALLFWLAVWEIVSLLIGNRVLLVSPVSALKTLAELAVTGKFWRAVLFSLLRITAGLFLGVTLGTLLAFLSSRHKMVRRLAAPLIAAVKSVPVASFVILALVWVSSKNLSILISFLIVLPVMYTGTLSGIENTDSQLIEMAEVFRIPRGRRVRYIYVSQCMPYFNSALKVALGLCWKSGIAAEVIGIPKGSIGEGLQQAKVYLETGEVFAWTITIIVLCVSFEKLALLLLRLAEKRLVSMPEDMTQTQMNPQKETGDIRLTDIVKEFDGRRVLDGYSLAIKGGRVTTVMEPSGWGKTTLLRIVAGLERQDGGEVEGSIPGKTGVVFQENRLCENLDAVTNIRLANTDCTKLEAEQALASVGMSECTGRPVSKLSGGQKRRVAICRALLSGSSLMLLDEPFEGMDEDTKNRVMDYTKRMTEGKTALLITHDRSEEEYFAQ